MRDVEITAADREMIRNYPEPKFRVSDWRISFSTNCNGDFWVFVAWGNTDLEKREPVNPNATILWKIREFFMQVSPSGGRFFIDSYGVSRHKEIGDGYPRFIRFITPRPASGPQGVVVKRPTPSQ